MDPDGYDSPPLHPSRRSPYTFPTIFSVPETSDPGPISFFSHPSFRPAIPRVPSFVFFRSFTPADPRRKSPTFFFSSSCVRQGGRCRDAETLLFFDFSSFSSEFWQGLPPVVVQYGCRLNAAEPFFLLFLGVLMLASKSFRSFTAVLPIFERASVSNPSPSACKVIGVPPPYTLGF